MIQTMLKGLFRRNFFYVGAAVLLQFLLYPIKKLSHEHISFFETDHYCHIV